ncbi:MAG: SMP-30/gluconolactonase/LRE family protein [Verrucomicrobia bacterium]|nr:SMP-30/gluconolactonase/LRE family protein [Verrucomicrobiota bacterium]
MPTIFFRATIAGLALLGCQAVGAGRSNVLLPGVQPDGSVQLPNQWTLRPVGTQVKMGDFPSQVALHPGGQYAAVLHCGNGPHEVRILDLRQESVISQVAIPQAFYGLAWSPDGKRLYVSGAANEVIHAFAFGDGYLSHHRELRVGPADQEGVPAGLAVSRDGSALYVAECWGQRVVKLGVNGQILWARPLAAAAVSSGTRPEEARRRPSEQPDAAYPYTCVADEAHGQIYVSLWAQSAVLVLDAATGAIRAQWKVGAHPNEMVLGADGRLYVAEANLNSVSVLDTATGKLTETLSASLYPNSPPGSMPNSLALSPDGTVLFVANANNNNLAVFDVHLRGRALSLGYIPVGWFPTSVRMCADGRTLVVANGKGLVSLPNPRGPNTHAPRSLEEYIGKLLQGTVSLIAWPKDQDRAAQLGEWSRAAYACCPLDATASVRGAPEPGNPIPTAVGGRSPIRYVIYIVRENRTYDQVLGDMPEGNGDPRLCLFGEEVTPNAHALAREFVLLDNCYADGEVSADGHEWSLGAQATDFVEKVWPLNYGHRLAGKIDYPSEGRYPVAIPANGYLWNRAAEAGVTYRSYGEFCTTPNEHTVPFIAEPSLPVLRGHIDPHYRTWDLLYRDVDRAARFISEVHRFEAEGDMPRLQVVQLPNDHTMGAGAGKPTPTAQVADNDLALGRIVEAVSRSKFWPETAIFVLEDDAQNGADHVDAHRMPTLVISPWTKRHHVDSTLYSTTSVLRTIELILGLQPMSQYDAAAMPMFASFAAKPDLAPFSAVAARVDLDAKNQPLAWGSDESLRMDFTAPDRADDIRLNEIVWRSVRGPRSQMPAPVRAAFFRTHRDGDADDDDDGG